MARYRGTTNRRGLGQQHRADRERLLALHHDGDLCWRCGQPMYKWQDLDRDHVIDRALGGAEGPAVLAHKSCNRAAGAKLGNHLRAQGTILAAGRDTICAVCGEPYHYAAKSCEVCGKHYHPNGREQRTCGRACGVELRRRKYNGRQNSKPLKPKPAPSPKPSCLICGKACSRAYSKFCSTACAAMAKTDATPIAYYTCRYCGKLGVQRASSQPGHGQREVCQARKCQLARLAANNLVARKGMTREQADAAVTGYRAEGDPLQLRSGRRRPPRSRPHARRRPVPPAAGYHQAALW